MGQDMQVTSRNYAYLHESLLLRMEYIAITSTQGGELRHAQSADGDVVPRVLQFGTKTKDRRNRMQNHVFFGVHSKPSNSELMEVLFCS